MNPREKFKTRPPISEAKELIADFLINQRILNVSLVKNDNTAIIDSIDYFYFKGKHIGILSPMSKVKAYIDDANTLSAFIQVGIGKESQKLYATFNYQLMDSALIVLDELEEVSPMIKKMRSHNAKFLELSISEATVVLSDQEIYNIDNDLNPTFAKFMPNGRERFENSRKLLMSYLDREVIFNVVIEDNVYYTLTKTTSNKMSHLKSGGVCKIFDGKDNHFETVIKIEEEKTNEIYDKLVATNNSYFKENIDLVALSFNHTK